MARREHSALELKRKLRLRGYEEPAVEALLAALAREGLQNDGRFAENYIHHRLQKGFGPLRLELELKQRGISAELISQYLDRTGREWVERATAARDKRFGGKPPASFQEQARQARFLQQRGFSGDQIRQLFKTGNA